MVSSIGADRVIDYTKEDFTQAIRRYDVILDTISNHSLGRLNGLAFNADVVTTFVPPTPHTSPAATCQTFPTSVVFHTRRP
jgi:NADPH:quinone reductase-like Zn-dependent oxidoreductase